MSSPSNQHAHRAGALAAAGLTAQIALAATDSLPVVKEVLGVVSRILTLYEDIEKRREALRDLVEDAQLTGQSIRAVLSGRTLEGEVLHSLEALLIVLSSIEAFLKKQKAKTGLRKLLGYAFTTSKHVDSLSQQLSRSSRRFLVIEAIDRHARLQDIERGVGKINQRRDYGFDKSELVAKYTPGRGQYCVNDLIARVHEPRAVLVIRTLNREQKPKDKKLHSGSNFDYDKVFRQFAKLLKSHPTIARLRTNRFTAMKSGYIPFAEIPPEDLTFEWILEFSARILVAARHLRAQGVSVAPGALLSNAFLDDAGTPFIRVHGDLQRLDMIDLRDEVWPADSLLTVPWHRHSTDGAQSTGPSDSRFRAMLWAGQAVTIRRSIPLGLLSALNEEPSTNLRNTMMTFYNDSCTALDHPAILLHAAALGLTTGATAPAFYAEYRVGAGRCDEMFVARAHATNEQVQYVATWIDIPSSWSSTSRKEFGIVVPVPPSTQPQVFQSRDLAAPCSLISSHFDWLR